MPDVTQSVLIEAGPASGLASSRAFCITEGIWSFISSRVPGFPVEITYVGPDTGSINSGRHH